MSREVITISLGDYRMESLNEGNEVFVMVNGNYLRIRP